MKTTPLNALFGARGLIEGLLAGGPRVPLSPEIIETLTNFDRVIGAALPKSPLHDPGAHAQCSFCGRYTVEPRSLVGFSVVACDCGEFDGWSGSFKPPEDGDQWSLCIGAPMRRRTW